MADLDWRAVEKHLRAVAKSNYFAQKAGDDDKNQIREVTARICFALADAIDGGLRPTEAKSDGAS